MNFINSQTNRILIIHTDGNTFNNPSLKCIIDLLIDNGYGIDLRYPKSHAPMPYIENIHFIPYGKLVGRIKHIIFNRFYSKFLMNLLVFLEYLFLYRNYDLVIGVDRQGLLEASILNQLKKIPYVFISFEIMFESETSNRYKALEREASKNISLWIVQDEVRAEKLMEENGLQSDNKYLLPLASAALGETGGLRLRDNLSIPKNKNVAIMIGSVGNWSMSNELIRSIADWPDDWVLILHERYGRTREILENELSDMEDLIGEKIFISDSASDKVDDMSAILSGINAGIAFYRPDYSGAYTGNNLKYLGLASGKISTYLRYGIPVIANEVGLYAEIIRKHNLGVIVSSPEDISNQLLELKNADYSGNAKKYFSQYLDFKIYSDNVLTNILSVTNKQESKANHK